MDVCLRGVVIVSVLFVSSTLFGCNRASQVASVEQSSKNNVMNVSTRLASISDTDKPATVANATQSKGSYYIDFHEKGRSVVFITYSDDKMHVVYNGKPGKGYDKVFNLRISPNGRRIAYVAEVQEKHLLITDGAEGLLYDDIGPPLFSPDSRHVACKVQAGDQLYILIDGKRGPAFRSFNGAPQFSGDSSRVIYSEGPEGGRLSRLIVSDLTFNNRQVLEGCGDQVVTNNLTSHIATVCVVNGKQRVIEFNAPQADKLSEGPLYDSISHLTFSKEGNSLAYAGEKASARYVIWNGREALLTNATLVADPVILPDQSGVGVIIGTSEKVFFHQVFKESVKKELFYEMIEDLVYSTDGHLHAYSAFRDNKWRIVVNGIEGPVFDRVIGPRFNPDSSLLVYRARQDGKRFVVVADATGKIIRQHQDYELVSPLVFTEDGASVAYGVKDSNELWWKVEKLK